MSHVRLFNHYIAAPLIGLGVIEILLLMLAAVLGNYIRFYGIDGFFEYDRVLAARALLFALVMLACTSAMGVYSAGFREGTGAMVVRTVASYCLLGCAALTILYYILPMFFMGRGVLAYSILAALVLVIPVRFLFYRLVGVEALRTRSMILGTGAKAAAIEQRMSGRAGGGTASLVGFVQMAIEPPEQATADEAPAHQVQGRIVQRDRPLLELARQHSVSEIVVALDERRVSGVGEFPLDELLDCKLNGIRVIEAVGFYERELGILELNEIRPGWMVFASGFSNSIFWDALKRGFDVLVAVVLLLLTWPLMLLAAIAIKLESRGPVIYQQTRVGLNGEEFSIMKFRSMVQNAEKDGVAQWAGKNDSRVTRVGAVLRNTRIDELPQLYNVLCGDMSIVGPRPERPEFVEDLNSSIQYYPERHRVKPGLMGWAQLNYPYGASIEDAAEKLRYDLYYVKNRSLLLDLIIMVQTVQVILLGTGVR